MKCESLAYEVVTWPIMSVQNNQPVIDARNNLDARNKAPSKATYDFSTLYANILNNKPK